MPNGQLQSERRCLSHRSCSDYVESKLKKFKPLYGISFFINNYNDRWNDIYLMGILSRHLILLFWLACTFLWMTNVVSSVSPILCKHITSPVKKIRDHGGTAIQLKNPTNRHAKSSSAYRLLVTTGCNRETYFFERLIKTKLLQISV